ncbi:toll/interleukin-1 receptor domain-containing protein [Aromatoleum toluclasticum]|uniref:toll/interleukin-1 receptor domain-containing protein n=1 Tax=Aromatoleum toluclasticum TaxID=92003 RepID=UPI001D17F6F8|nr:toll/interleukin-1 receptor domain-containing protein [Aromatoleum toluclasticum]MCC4113892.1 toll/interleukin-1 receptor domain-containing protein [Aromatoleum toluclasticum]
MARIFFSYASEDKPKVVEALSEFTKRNHDVLIDYEQIKPGTSIPGGINQMIRCADAAVLFHSEAYNRKPWATEEQDALQFRLVEHPDFHLAVIRLETAELPPLLAHRVWTLPGGIGALADMFAESLRERLTGATTQAESTEVPNWLQVLNDDDLERLARAIELQIHTAPATSTVVFSSKKTGSIRVHLVKPLARGLVDTLAFLIRVLDDVTFLRLHLREQIAHGVGMFEGPYMLQERKRMRQVEDYREELRSTLDVLVERVTLA